MFELEKRGFLNNGQIGKLRTFLKKEGKLISKSNQLNIFIESDNLYLGEVSNTKASISIIINNNLDGNHIRCSLKGKLGKMETSLRKEIVIPFELENIKNIYDFLGIFNITTGCPRFYYREDYKFNDYILTIKQKGLAPDHFEIEKQLENKNNIIKEINEIKKIIQTLGLNLISEDEYKILMLKIYKENPPVDLDSINLSVIY